MLEEEIMLETQTEIHYYLSNTKLDCISIPRKSPATTVVSFYRIESIPPSAAFSVARKISDYYQGKTAYPSSDNTSMRT